MRRRDVSAVIGQLLKDYLNGPMLRQIIGLRDTGAVEVGTVGSDIGTTEIDSDKKHVLVHGTKPMHDDTPSLGRLYVPAGILFRIPQKGESYHEIRASECDKAALVLPDGGDGSAAFTPDWLGDSDAGIYATDQAIHIESKNKDVVFKAAGCTITLTNDSKVVVAAGDSSITVNKDSDIAITAKSGSKVSINGTDWKLAKADKLVQDVMSAIKTIYTILNAGTAGSPVKQQIVLASLLTSEPLYTGTSSDYLSDKATNG